MNVRNRDILEDFAFGISSSNRLHGARHTRDDTRTAPAGG